MPSAAVDLTDIDAVKLHLGIDAGDPRADDVLQAYVTAASRAFTKLTTTEIKSASYTDVFSGDGISTGYVLKYGPVISVPDNGVTVDGMTLAKQTAVGGNGWVLTGSLIQLVGAVFTAGVSNVSIVYTAGFATVPEDVAFAVVEWAAFMYRARERIGVASQGVAGEQLTYTRMDQGIPASVMATAENYRRICT